ncbi:phage tail fiber C-terminal domain-containing protein, partial [Escherichia coli]
MDDENLPLESETRYGKHDDREHGELLTAQLRLGPADILESDENGIIPEQDRVITQVVILDA